MHTTGEIQEIVKGYIGDFIEIADIGDEVHVFETGLLNSLFAIELMTFLEKSFEIKVGMDDLDMAHFESINAITTFVARKEAEKIR